MIAFEKKSSGCFDIQKIEVEIEGEGRKIQIWFEKEAYIRPRRSACKSALVLETSDTVPERTRCSPLKRR